MYLLRGVRGVRSWRNLPQLWRQFGGKAHPVGKYAGAAPGFNPARSEG
jgi:hypothetical protein